MAEDQVALPRRFRTAACADEGVMSTRPLILSRDALGMLRNGDNQWIVPAAILVLCQHVAALVISHAIGFNSRPPTFRYMVIAFVISLVGGSIIAMPRIW